MFWLVAFLDCVRKLIAVLSTMLSTFVVQHACFFVSLAWFARPGLCCVVWLLLGMPHVPLFGTCDKERGIQVHVRVPSIME